MEFGRIVVRQMLGETLAVSLRPFSAHSAVL